MGSAAPSSPDTPAGSAAWAGGGGELGVPSGRPTCCPGPPPALWAHSARRRPHPPAPRGPHPRPPPPAPALGPWDGLNGLLHGGAAEEAASLGAGGLGRGWAAFTGSSPALGAIVCPPGSQPSFHLLKCKSSPVVLLPTALPHSHGSQLPGRRPNSSASVPAAPLHPTVLASAWPPLLQLPPASSVSGVGGGARADGSLSRKTPSPPAQPQPLASSSGCVLGGYSMLLTPWPLPPPRCAPKSLLPGPPPPC